MNGTDYWSMKLIRRTTMQDTENQDTNDWEKQFQTARKDLEVHYAKYGTEAEKRDVISYVTSRISLAGRLNLLVNNDNLGGDHYSGKAKQLHIIYTFNGVLCEEDLDEGEMLVIPKLQVIEVKEMQRMEWFDILLLILAAGLAGGSVGYLLAGYEGKKKN